MESSVDKNLKQVVNVSKGVLDYIHSDLWGSSPTISYGGEKKYVLFVDEFSRKVWVYIIKRKDDVFNIFKQFRVNGGKKNWQDNQVFKDG